MTHLSPSSPKAPSTDQASPRTLPPSLEELKARAAAAYEGRAKRALAALEAMPHDEHPEVMGPKTYERNRPG